jgi:Protein of unknown function (DUF1217)
MVDLGAFNASLASYLPSLLGASSASSAPAQSALAGYQPYLVNENANIATYQQQTASVQQAVAYFKSHISQVKNVTQLTQDPKLLQFVTVAFGLDADAQYPAKIAAVLNSDLSQQNSYANALLDPRYQQLAQEFNVHANGVAKFSDSTTINDVVNRYLTNSYEENLSSTANPALRDAAYFLRNIGSVTNAYQILSDPVLRTVVETVTGLPANIAVQPVQDQAALINSKVNLSQFSTGSSSSGGAASQATPLSNAQAELTKLSSATAVVTAAQKSAQSVVDQITAIQTAQSNLANIQNASGPFASEIPVQQAAAPVLVEQQGLLAAAQSATSTVTSDISQLQSLLKQAGDPNNTTSISTLQAEFTSLASGITSAISGASYRFDNNTGGTAYTSQNLIDGSLGSAITAQYDSSGDTTTVNPQNLGSGSTFQTQLSAALTAFTQGTPDIASASASLASASNAANIVTQSVNNDATNFSDALASVSSPFSKWAGTYNTAQIYLGSQSLSDAGSRLTLVHQYLGELQSIAQESAQLGSTADRSTLQSQFSDVLGQLTGAINTTQQSGVDNLLSSGAAHSYNLTGNYDVQAQGQDLVTNVLNQLSGLDVSSAANANAVVTAISGTTVQNALTAAGQQFGIASQAFATATTIDPASTVYSQYAKLAAQIPTLVTSAASNGTNLLDKNQVSGLTVTATAAQQVLTINPESSFDSSVTQVVSAGSALLLSDPTTAFADLTQAAFSANSILSHLNSDAGQLQYATSLTNTRISALQKQQTSTSATSAGLPVNATAFAKQFVQKYLAAVDAQNAASGTSSGGNSYLLQLFQTSQSSSGAATSIAGINLNVLI